MQPSDFSPEELHRIELTTSVHDTDAIPKVAGAGEVQQRCGQPVQVMHNGVLVEAGGYYGSWMTEVIRRLRGHHEPQEELAFDAVVTRLASDTPAPVVVELGSFWAYYSLWVQRVMPAARLLLVEPDPEYLSVGRRNVALNEARAAFLQAAVGPPGQATVDFTAESDGLVRTLPSITVDQLVSQRGLERIDVLLCDVQGAELQMLAGAEALLRRRGVRFVVLSTHHHRISADPLVHERCLEVLRNSGAHVIAEHTVSESCSGDGLIVASLDPRDLDLSVVVSRVRARDSLFGEVERDLAAALVELGAARRRLEALGLSTAPDPGIGG